MASKAKTSKIIWNIRVEIGPKRPRLSEIALKQLSKQILKEINLKGLPLADRCEMGVIITDDPGIKILNKKYRGKNKPTDVLSFSMIEGADLLLKSPTLGDVVISLPTAVRQAEDYDVNLHQEILRLLIHGTLHLLGYDHENVSKKKADLMRKTEEQIYEKLKFKGKKLVN
jgi:probable rRNA maturation factor